MSRQGSRNVKDSTGREVPGSEEKEEEKRTQCFRESILLYSFMLHKDTVDHIYSYLYTNTILPKVFTHLP